MRHEGCLLRPPQSHFSLLTPTDDFDEGILLPMYRRLFGQLGKRTSKLFCKCDKPFGVKASYIIYLTANESSENNTANNYPRVGVLALQQVPHAPVSVIL